MRLTVIESPYAGKVEENLAYLDQAILHCLRRNESPYASHKMLTTALNDNIPVERRLGIDAGLAFRRHMHNRAFYIDLGWSGGMEAALRLYLREGLTFELRTIYGEMVWESCRTAFTPGLLGMDRCIQHVKGIHL